MFLDKRNHEGLGLAKEIEFAFNILNYNQGLIQFADSKANALLLINSIFIASIGPFLDIVKKGGHPIAAGMIIVFFISSIASILISMGVIMTRKVPEVENAAKGLVFYGHIIETRSPEGYIHEVANYDAKRFLENILANIFVVSTIASRKYALYIHSQTLTVLSSFFWILSMIYLFLA